MGEIVRTPSEEFNHKQKWRSIWICCVVIFFSSVQYSIQMSSLWPYMQTLDQRYEKDLLGWVVSIFSVGQLIAAPIYSFIAGKTYKFTILIIVSLFMALLSNYLYICIADIPQGIAQTVGLLGSRFFMGLGGGNIATIQLFISIATTEEERLGTLAIFSSFQSVGLIIGPSLQAIFVVAGYPGPIEVTMFHLNMYTLSSFFNIVSCISLIFVVSCMFSEKFLLLEKSKEKTNTEQEKEDESNYEQPEFVGRNILATYIVVSFFFCMITMSILETTATPVVMDNFGWSSKKATLITSIALGVIGLVSLGIFASIKYLKIILSEKYIFVTSYTMLMIMFLIAIPWGSGKIPLEESYKETNMLDNNSTSKTITKYGCNLKQQPWCEYIPRLQYWQGILAMILFGLAYPATNLMSYVTFTRVVLKEKLSIWMGILTSTGSLGRIIGPIYISHIYYAYGCQVAYGSYGGILFVYLLGSPYFIMKMTQLEIYNARLVTHL